MQMDWLGLWRAPFLDLPARQFEGLALLGLYGLTLILALIGTRQTWSRQRNARRVFLLIALCLAAVALNNLLDWHAPIARPPVPNRPLEAGGVPAPLLGSLPVLLVGAWFGLGPALVAGLIGGLTRALFIQGQLTPAFELAFFGLIAAFLLRQDYAGRAFAILRQPFVAGLVARLLIWPLTLPGLYVHTPGEPLYALDVTWPLFLSGFWPALAEGLLAGLGGQLLYASARGLRPVREAHSAPPFERSLNRRLLFTLVPIMLVMIAVLMYAVTATTITAATQQAIDQMARDAASATQDLPFFFQNGQSLLGSLTSSADLRSADAAVRQSKLAEGVRTGAFFDELLLTDASGQSKDIYPAAGSKQQAADETTLVTRTLTSGAPGVSSVYRVTTDTLRVSFVVPLDGRAGALIGRARLNVNPIMMRALTGLQKTLGTGEGLVVDEQNRIVLAPPERAVRLMTDWQFDDAQPPLAQVGGGKVYINSIEDGTRRLIYVAPIQGYPWTAVIELPYAAVLGLAAQVSAPLLALLLIVTVVTGLAVFGASRRVTRPLSLLSQATAQIAEGQLGVPVLVRGEDEVGQLGEAFEQMRASLKGRLEDLSLLVRVSNSVASSMDLDRGVPPILEGAMEASGARAARLILLERGAPVQPLWRRGELPG
jgi:HAMP domain-containing protein